MDIRIRRLAAAALALLVSGASSLVLADEAADRAAIEAAAQSWVKALNARDVQTMLTLATDDIVLLDANMPPISGGEAARRAWQRVVDVAPGQITTATKEAAISGDIAWRIGAFRRNAPTGEAATGQSLEIWKRVKGQWKLHRQMSSNILAPPKLIRPPPSEPVLDKPAN